MKMVICLLKYFGRKSCYPGISFFFFKKKEKSAANGHLLVVTHNSEKKPTSSQHSVFAAPEIPSLKAMHLFWGFFTLIYLTKSSQDTGKPEIAPQIQIQMKLSLHPANRGYSSELTMVSSSFEAHFLCIAQIH